MFLNDAAWASLTQLVGATHVMRICTKSDKKMNAVDSGQ